MAEHRDSFNLEEQLRQDRRLAANHRRRRRLKRLLPLGVFLVLAVLALIPLIQKYKENKPDPNQTALQAEVSAELAFVGDIALDEAAIRFFGTGTGYDFTPCFRWVTPQLTEADLTIGNLEGNISDTPADHNYPPALLDTLYASGFDILQTANSYSIQNGIAGLKQTKLAIEQAGMQSLGTYLDAEDYNRDGGVLIREVNGIRFAFIGFTKGVNSLRLPEGAEHCVNLLYTDYDTNYSRIARDDILAVLENAKAESPDVIIAMVHWGSEYTQEIADSQKEIAALLFSNGVSLIVGSHSHYVGPIQKEPSSIFHSGTGYVAYSLGDFLSMADTSSARNGCILNVSFEKKGAEARMTSIRYTPTYSAAPDANLDIGKYEILDSLDAISLYENGYYDSVSRALYDRLCAAVERMKEQTEAGELQTVR